MRSLSTLSTLSTLSVLAVLVVLATVTNAFQITTEHSHCVPFVKHLNHAINGTHGHFHYSLRQSIMMCDVGMSIEIIMNSNCSQIIKSNGFLLPRESHVSYYSLNDIREMFLFRRFILFGFFGFKNIDLSGKINGVFVFFMSPHGI